MGMHVDHRGGAVYPIAIKELFLVASPRDDDVVLVRNVEAAQFPAESFRISECLPSYKIAEWDAWCLDELEKRKCDPSVTWSNYLRASVLYLQHTRTRMDGTFAPPLRGMDVMVYGCIPRSAGLSSSSSLVVAAADACIRINELDVEPMEFVDICGYGEWYVGTRGGAGDHAAIKFGRPDAVSRITSFPLTQEVLPFPSGYNLVLANSLVEANKRAGARDIFNNRVASYIFGLMLIEKNFPQYVPRMKHLRDINPENLGVDEAGIYRILKSLPEVASRETVLKLLPSRQPEVRRVFRSHVEPPEGYSIRQVCVYGVCECIRSELAAERLRNNDIRGFGELLNVSHEGDRVSRLAGDRRCPVQKDYSDAKIEELIRDIASEDEKCRERACLWRQPGGYNVSVPELDALVDISLQTPGVVGAGLVGAGLGGCILVLVEERTSSRLLENLAREYYEPRDLPMNAESVAPVGGAGILEL
jgi:N-acetylgalactosamine kinase